ncbi:MAG: hypothetical protein H0T42_02545 [Deltaproteobacteria bacterium]|nr:hypothetical protein [Deltaproteobacteria bacterium]
MQQRIKLDPVAYALLCGVIGLQVYTTFLRTSDVDTVIAASDRAYQSAVFANEDSKGVMHQVFRQNEVDRDLLKAVLSRCAH